MSDLWIRLLAVLTGASGIALAAFGSHGLERHTDEKGLRWWAIGVAIQLVTAPVILWCSRAAREAAVLPLAPILLALGVVLFSGSLYAMSLGAPRWFGAITPLGGLCLIAGWIALAFRAG
ncbi:MAG TPA: DUF423 domain-containing protein [Polyangiaceae bacterium]|nr:DUF423 domain-containing protein [Polyangiaceae bacterium]